MLFAFGPEDLTRFALPIGIGIAVLLFLIVPSLRRGIIDSFQKGKRDGERWKGKDKPDGDGDQEIGSK